MKIYYESSNERKKLNKGGKNLCVEFVEIQKPPETKFAPLV
jgi:hypothetical protein